MDRWAAIRSNARDVLSNYEQRTEVTAFGPNGGIHDRLAFVARGFRLSIVDDPTLPAGILGQLEEEVIRVRADLSAPRKAFTVAHEIGHRALEHPARPIIDGDEHIDDTADAAGFLVRDGVYRSYGERDRWELEANIFASELLAPVAVVQQRIASNPGWTVDELATYFGLSRAAMLNQMAAALLPGPPDIPVPGDPDSGGLDPEQLTAATVEPPALVIAGPGAGKTRILVERFAWLVRQGADPRRVLALTFANKAAEEMRERLAAALPAHAHVIHVATFHSFGLDLLQEFGLAGNPSPRLITPPEAFTLIRARIAELDMGRFVELHRPTMHVKALLDAVSSAKDELADPDLFRVLAAAWSDDLLSRPRPEDAGEAEALDRETDEAAASLDISLFYTQYQQILRSEGCVDYGDLIMEATRLFSTEAAAEIRERYDHILVDEFQDVNYASGRLVQELDGGRGIVWAVGDPRQSIFRFRGASPANLRDFEANYPGARIVPLELNYRSVEDVVAAGQAVCIPDVEAELPVPKLRSHRGRVHTDPAVNMIVSPSGNDELAAIVSVIRAEEPRDLSEMVVLCRSNTQAQEVADALDSAGIPNTWGGALKDRAVFKDLLSILLLATGDPQGLVRVARIAEHALSEEDLLLVLRTAGNRGGSLRAALRAASYRQIERLSEAGVSRCRDLRLLAMRLRRCRTSWQIIADYLFEHASWPRLLFSDDSVSAYRDRSTLGQLAGIARSYGTHGGDAVAFLDFVRSCLEAGDLPGGKEVSASRASVGILTVHKSKGLEWPVVVVPNMANKRFPGCGRDQSLRLPPGLIHNDPGSDEADEARLFYVAVTRARDFLVLTRAEKYGRNRHQPSPLLDGFLEGIGAAGVRESAFAAASPEEVPPASPPPSMTPWKAEGPVAYSMLAGFEKCGLRFKYEQVYGLRGDDGGYHRFHRATYEMLNWVAESARQGNSPETWEREARFAEIWDSSGPIGHWYESVYHRFAERTVAGFTESLEEGRNIRLRNKVEFEIDGRSLVVTIDEIEDGTPPVWRRHHFGRPAKSHHDKDDRLALFAAAHTSLAKQGGAEGIVVVQLRYPLIRKTEDVSMTDLVIKKRIGKLGKLLEDMETGAFSARPGVQCVTCPFCLICPA